MTVIRSYRSLVLLTGLLLVLGMAPLHAATSGTDLPSDDDTWIQENFTGQPGGSGASSPKETALKVQHYPSVNEMRALVHFDLSQFTGLGTGSTVSAATLKLTYSNASGAPNGNPATHLRVYQLTQSFTGGDPSPSDTNNVGASWDQRYNGAMKWTTQGGDFKPALGTGTLMTTAVAPATNAVISFDVTAIVNNWVNNGEVNGGFVLIDDSEATQDDFYLFIEGGDYAQGSAANGPQLNVTYTSVTGNTLTATQDTSISGAINNIGGDHQIRIDGSADERMLVKFAIGAIPGGENVQSAILRIKSAGTDFGSGESGGQAGTGVLSVYKLTQPAWTEGTGTRTAQGSGAGSGAQWDKYDGTTAWVTNGGDFDATRTFLSPSTTIAGNDVDVVIDIDVTAVVAEQHTAAAASADFLIKGSSACDWRIGSKEYAGGLPAAPRTAQLIVTSSTSAGPGITVTTPGGLTQGANGTVNWTYTGALSTFNVFLIDASANAKQVNVSPISGSAGTGTFTWSVNANAAPLTGPGAGFTIKVVEATKLFQGVSGTFAVTGPMSITTSSPIASATQGSAYAGVTFTATGGAGGYTWTATNVPAGMTLAAGGLLNGIPTTNGTFNMVVTVTDSALSSINKTIKIVVAPSPGALVLSFTKIPNPKIGVPYTYTATATGGVAAKTWSAVGLPTGLTINPATGVISGTDSDPIGTTYSGVVISVTDGTTTATSPTITVKVVAAGATTSSGGKKGGCSIGSGSSDLTAFLFVIALAGLGMVFSRFNRKSAIA